MWHGQGSEHSMCFILVQMYPCTLVPKYQSTIVPPAPLYLTPHLPRGPCGLRHRHVSLAKFLFLGFFLSHHSDRDGAASAVHMAEVPRALVPDLLTAIFPVSRLFPVFRENDGQSWNELKRSLRLSRIIFDLTALLLQHSLRPTFLTIIRPSTIFQTLFSQTTQIFSSNNPTRLLLFP